MVEEDPYWVRPYLWGWFFFVGGVVVIWYGGFSFGRRKASGGLYGRKGGGRYSKCLGCGCAGGRKGTREVDFRVELLQNVPNPWQGR